MTQQHETWLTANQRIKDNPHAAHWIVSQYSDKALGRNTAICAAYHNTPYWQMAVAITSNPSARAFVEG